MLNKLKNKFTIKGKKKITLNRILLSKKLIEIDLLIYKKLKKLIEINIYIKNIDYEKKKKKKSMFLKKIRNFENKFISLIYIMIVRKILDARKKKKKTKNYVKKN